MKEQLAVQKLLRRKLGELQAKNSAFSVRAFANRLGLQPSATNEILRGERRISRKMAERIAARLHLDPSERAELLAHFPERSRRRKPVLDAKAREAAEQAARSEVLRLTADQFSLISDWAHFAILNLVKTVDAESTVEWIADRLGITPTRASAAIERLERMKMLERDPAGKWRRTYARVNTPDDVLDLSIRKSHLEDMELARESLLRDPIDARDFTSMTMAIDPAMLPKAKEILRRAQDEVAELMADRPTTEVYRLTTYLFPMTRRTKKEGAKKR